MNMEKFHLNSREQYAIDNLQKEMDTYILQKYTHFSSGAVPCNSSILSIQDYMRVISPVSAEKSNIVYMQVLDAKSESKDTLMTIFFYLHQRFIEQRGNEFLVLTADAKLYEVLQSLKHEYGEELKWLLPFPGDWHMMKNFQVALMKPYFDMGLRELARAAGYPVAAMQSCSQFKRTQLLDVMACKGPNWKFWKQFVFEDGLAYIGLFIAIRSGNRELRLASIKLMAPVCTAFDHQTYQKLIAQHLADLCSFPNKVTNSFKQGGFVVSLSGTPWHSVAIDEAHEMKINKECKMSIVQPSQVGGIIFRDHGKRTEFTESAL